ncbi:hypothetical protein GGR54DRAFT_54931 [Hypoxylon sp. NC1633]|nr:hypothetical protein GGR54DRAFT_54931 [Hypoxylon sp. NC1633]
MEYSRENEDDALGQSQVVTGSGTWREGAVAAFNRPIFSHFRRRGLSEVGEDAGAGAEDVGANAMHIRDLLKSATNLEEASKMVCGGLVTKISSLGMIPIEDIKTDRPMSAYGMDSLVAVEMRN